MRMLIILVLTGLISRSNSIPAGDWQQVKSEIQKLIKQSGGTVAIAFEDLKTGKTFYLNEKVAMHAASTMKTAVMIEVFKQAQQGRFQLSDSLLVKNEFRSIVDGSPFSLDIKEDSDDMVYRQIGHKMAIRGLVYQMITMSSNLATNILIELVTAKAVMQTMQEIGAHRIRILRGVEDPKAFQKGLNNTTDAYDMLLIMKAIAQKTVVTPVACEEMIGILTDQKLNKKIPALLPPTVKVAHKTGSIFSIDHDAAIVYKSPDHAYILVVLTRGIQDHQQAEALIARISRLIYDAI
ncbi:MAG: class A beta-lactamase-related serine hydrolase [candidate division KSB1 bacterium]|nr:class A beta-lactamase-related serine hydrolase [candidate division KSB1 bacterium]MDZ7339727.1 class A beta-lactamase-related serine hydrolase [candidate division KSB1 bacterium]